MEKSNADILLLGAKYIFAKTMPQNPHFYTLRQTWDSQQDFEAVVQFIRDRGEVEIYKGRAYICYKLDGYKYWTMGNLLNQTKLINRAKL